MTRLPARGGSDPIEDAVTSAAARLRSFAADEAGASSLEFFLIAAFCGATAAVLLEVMGISLAGALGFGTRARN